MNGKVVAGSISMLFDWDKLTIEIEDREARSTIATVVMNRAQVMQAFSRLCSVDCMVRFENLDRVGKKHSWESKRATFDSTGMTYAEIREMAQNEVKRQCPAGWVPDLNLASQGAIVTRDGITTVVYTARRWDEYEDPNGALTLDAAVEDQVGAYV